MFAFKGCSWRAIPALPRCVYQEPDKLVELVSSRAFKWYAEPYVLILVLDPLISIECPGFKGCSWRAIPAHPQCANWLYHKLVELASSRTFKWCTEPCTATYAPDQSVQFVPFWWQKTCHTHVKDMSCSSVHDFRISWATTHRLVRFCWSLNFLRNLTNRDFLAQFVQKLWWNEQSICKLINRHHHCLMAITKFVSCENFQVGTISPYFCA